MMRLLRRALLQARWRVALAHDDRARVKAAEWRGSSWAARVLHDGQTVDYVHCMTDLTMDAALRLESKHGRAFDDSARVTAERFVRTGRCAPAEFE